MKNLFAVVILSCIALQATSQYYYLDIAGTKQTNQQYRLLKAFQVKKISASSFENNIPSKDFLLEQTVGSNGQQIVTRSATAGSAQSYFISNFKNNRVMHTVDSSNNAVVNVLYDYDNSGRLFSVTSTSKDFDGKFTSTETHTWSYNDKGLPTQMLKVKNKADTTYITFTLDEEDNVAEERWTKNNRTIETYYYYYNHPKKLLTDIVRFHPKAKTMLPDYMFEYDAKGHITQMTQTQSGKTNYIIWKYLYNENGMKQKEVAFNKEKELLGRIEYTYVAD